MSLRKADIDLRGHTNGQFKTTCPFCSASRTKSTEPCLAVNLDAAVYDCHHCNETGRIVDVIATKSFAGRERSYKTPNIDELTKYALVPDEQFLNYFHERGITDDVLVQCRVSYGNSFPEYDLTKRLPNGKAPIRVDADGIPIIHKGIRFPFFEYGRLVSMKHMRPPAWTDDGVRQTRIFKDSKMVPFNFDAAGKRLIITEGEIDALSWIVAGVNEVWSVPNGAKSFDWLGHASVIEKLTEANDIFLSGDADEEGRLMRTELIRRLKELFGGAERIWLVDYPEDCKDPNDVLVKYGKERLLQCLTDAYHAPVAGITYAREFSDEFMSFYQNGLPTGMSTGIPSLDEIYRVMEGTVTVFSGVTNYGKSELIDELARFQVLDHHAKLAFYTLENRPYSLHMMKLAEKYIGKPFDTRKPGHMSYEEAEEAWRWIDANMFYITPPNGTYTIKDILEKARILIFREGITGLVIDPWNHVKKNFEGLREDQFINEAMQDIVAFARDTGVWVWLVVHPRTLSKDKNGKIEVPTIHQLSGGSKFGDNMDFFVVVHRDPKAAFDTGIHEVTIFNQKSRYRHIAQQGDVTVEWEPFNGRFKERQGANVTPIHETFVPAEGEYDEAF